MIKHYDSAAPQGTGLNPLGALIDGAMHSGTRAGNQGSVFNPLSALIDGLMHTGATIATWQRRADERSQLEHLDDRLLRDAGIDPYAASHEAKKPFWRR